MKPEDDPLLEARLGSVTLEQCIVCEPESVLYRAITDDGQIVAARVLPHDLHGHQQAIASFVRVAIRATAVEHPNVASVIDHGDDGSSIAWMILDWSDTPSLGDWLSEGTRQLRLDRAGSLSLQLLSGLIELHRAGLVHGRISPHAFRWLGGGTDADWLQLIHCGHGWTRQEKKGNYGAGLKGRNGWSGPRPWSPYQSPMLFKRTDVSELIDLYSAGVCVYQLFTRNLPYRSNRPADIVKILRSGKRLHKLPASHRRGELNRYPSLLRVLARALDDRPNHRFRTAKEFYDALVKAIPTPSKILPMPDSQPVARSKRKRTSRGVALEHIKHKPTSPNKSRQVLVTPPSSPKFPPPQDPPEERRARRRGISLSGVRFEDLDKLAESLNDMTHEAMSVLGSNPPSDNLRALEEALGVAPDSRTILSPEPAAPISNSRTEVLATDDTRQAIWAAVCLTSPRLRQKARGTLQGVAEADYRVAMSPLRHMATHTIERANRERGSWICLLGPGENVASLLGPVVMFLMAFERTHHDEPPSVTIAAGPAPTRLEAGMLGPSFKQLIAEVWSLVPVAHGGEMIARPELIDAMGVSEVSHAVSSERAAPIDPLVCWQFVVKEAS